MSDRPFLDAGPAATTPSDVVAFRYRTIGGDVLLTSVLGDWLFVTRAELASLVRGDLPVGGPLHDKLAGANFIRSKVDSTREAERLARKKRFLNHGPSAHLCVVTNRSNQTCPDEVGRAPMDAAGADMTPEVADGVVDFVLQSTSPSVTIELGGGEPLLCFPLVQHIVQSALQRNRAYGKELAFTLATNLSRMDDDKLAWLVDHKVQVCTFVDGPESLHVGQRVLAGGNSFREAARWIERINRRYIEMGLDPSLYHVEARLVTTPEALRHPVEIVDTYASLGCRTLFLRPVDPFALGESASSDPLAYHEFYRAALGRILSRDLEGEHLVERYAALFLTRILRDEEPDVADVRSPTGSGIGALAYGHDGTIFTSDEGRLLHAMGDDAFAIGHVATSRYRDVMRHPTVRALVLASIREAQPDCESCTYAPYCGISPEHSYRTMGSIFGRMRESALCAVHKGIQDHLFAKLREDDPPTRAIFERWATRRARTHFVHTPAAS